MQIINQRWSLKHFASSLFCNSFVGTEVEWMNFHIIFAFADYRVLNSLL